MAHVMAKQPIDTNLSTNELSAPSDPLVLSVGQRLKQRRQQKGITIKQVSETLKIRTTHLQDLENDSLGDHDDDVNFVYQIGFVRNYAQILNLNDTDLVQQYRTQHRDKATNNALATPLTAASTRRVPKIFLSVMALIAVYGSHHAYTHPHVWMGWMAQTKQTLASLPKQSEPAAPTLLPLEKTDKNTEINTHAIDTNTIDTNSLANKAFDIFTEDSTELNTQTKSTLNIQNTPNTESPATQAPLPNTIPDSTTMDLSLPSQPAPSIPTAATIKTLSLQTIEPTWAQLKDQKGSVIWQKTLTTGYTCDLPCNQGCALTLGNAGGVMLCVNGKNTKPLGKSGDVIHRLTLDEASLTTYTNID
jgi:cytoskeleton protein RodZ